MSGFTTKFVQAYRASDEERIAVGYLIKAPAIDVVNWLKGRWTDADFDCFGSKSRGSLPYERKLVEYLLARRNDSLVDWGIARYGTSTAAIQRVFDRGNSSTQIAAVANPYGNIRLRQYGDILRRGKWPFVRALLQSVYIPSSFLSDLLYRQQKFADINDYRLQGIVHALTGNPRLTESYDDRVLDGWAEYTHDKVFQAAWDLTKSVPTTQHWAATLCDFLSKCNRPDSIDGLESVLERWRVDEPPKREPVRWIERSRSFSLRSLTADFIKPDAALLAAQDAALRMSFYRRFSYRDFPDWPDFLNRDGEEFTNAALQNKHLWASEVERERLRRVCWDTPDPQSWMEMPNSYNATEDQMRRDRPEWFKDEQPPSEPPDGDKVDDLKQQLLELSSKIDDLVSGNLRFSVSSKSDGHEVSSVAANDIENIRLAADQLAALVQQGSELAAGWQAYERLYRSDENSNVSLGPTDREGLRVISERLSELTNNVVETRDRGIAAGRPGASRAKSTAWLGWLVFGVILGYVFAGFARL